LPIAPHIGLGKPMVLAYTKRTMTKQNLKNILSNIDLARRNVAESRNIKVLTLVSGNDNTCKFWEEKISVAIPYILNKDKSTVLLSFAEKIGKKNRAGNFLGTLLAYERLRDTLSQKNIDYRGFVAVIGMLFGRGERVSPFTQMEGGCKPAIIVSSANEKKGRVYLSEIEEALMFFTPVAKYIEKGGFRGILNKWGDQTIIPSIDLTKAPLGCAFQDHDVIKFVSVIKVTEKLANVREWVISDKENNVMAQLSRKQRTELVTELEAYGIKPGEDGEYHAGVSLGPVAVSYDVLDIAHNVFRDEIKKEGVYFDFDPYVFMALAARGDRSVWDKVLSRDKKLQEFAGPDGMIPDFFEKINIVREAFRERHGREMNIKTVDLGPDVFWLDIGQHDHMREKYMYVNEDTCNGIIARRIENIPDKRDKNGNIIVNSYISPDVDITDSVVINSRITGSGRVEFSVIRDSVFGDLEMNKAFAVLCYRTGRTELKTDSGLYRSIGSTADILSLGEGMRQGTMLTPEGPVDMTVFEGMDLKDKNNVYNVPVLGNIMSFLKAYEMMSGADLYELERRRKVAMENIEMIDKISKKFKQLSFGTSGLRDTVDNMTDMECYINTRGFVAYLAAIGEFKKGSVVAVGCDRRPSSPRIKAAVAMAVRDMGGKVDDEGLVSSPALANYAIQKGIPSIMVTGSHIPADRNGIKFTKISGEVLKSDEKGILSGVAEERKKVYLMPDKQSRFNAKGMFKPASVKTAKKLIKKGEYAGPSAKLYTERYKKVFGKTAFSKGAEIFLYQHSAVGRDLINDIFKGIGAAIFAPTGKIKIKYTDENGKKRTETVSLRSKEFVPVDTESVSARTMAVFKEVMNKKKLDTGISMDGDSDRPLLVYRVYDNGKPTDEVRYVTGDILGLLTVLGLGELGVNISSVSVPVSANDAISMVLKEKGTELFSTKIGSPYVIAGMNGSISAHGKNNPVWKVCGWESNGGFLLGSDITINGNTLKALPTRDAALPLIAVTLMAAKRRTTVSALLDELPKRYTHADRKKEFPVESGRAIISFLSPEDGNIKKIQFPNNSEAVVMYQDGRVEKTGSDGEGFKIKKRVEAFFTAKDGFSDIVVVNYTDGVRMIFSNGEISHLRPSGNAPEFRNYAIAGTPERARGIVEMGINSIIPAIAKAAAKK